MTDLTKVDTETLERWKEDAEFILSNPETLHKEDIKAFLPRINKELESR